MSTWMILRVGGVGHGAFSVLQAHDLANLAGEPLPKGHNEVARKGASSLDFCDLKPRFPCARISALGRAHEHPRISGQGTAREVRRAGSRRPCRDERRGGGRSRRSSSPGRCGWSRRRSTPAAAARASSRNLGPDAKGGVRLAQLDRRGPRPCRGNARQDAGHDPDRRRGQAGPAPLHHRRRRHRQGILPGAAGRPRDRPHRHRRLDRGRHGHRGGRPRHAGEDRDHHHRSGDRPDAAPRPRRRGGAGPYAAISPSRPPMCSPSSTTPSSAPTPRRSRSTRWRSPTTAS